MYLSNVKLEISRFIQHIAIEQFFLDGEINNCKKSSPMPDEIFAFIMT